MKNTKVVRRIATNMMKKVKKVAVTSGTKLVLAFVTVKLITDIIDIIMIVSINLCKFIIKPERLLQSFDIINGPSNFFFFIRNLAGFSVFNF